VKDGRPNLLNKLALVEISIVKYDQKCQRSHNDLKMVSNDLDLFSRTPEVSNAEIHGLQQEISIIAQERMEIAE
jgi:hypothetical protein